MVSVFGRPDGARAPNKMSVDETTTDGRDAALNSKCVAHQALPHGALVLRQYYYVTLFSVVDVPPADGRVVGVEAVEGFAEIGYAHEAIDGSGREMGAAILPRSVGGDEEF